MDEIISKIKEFYGIQAHSPEKVTAGFLSENHVLSDGKKKYFLKRYRFDKEETIKEIHAVKKYFADGGIPVILPILNTKGDTFFFLNGGYYALFPYVEDKIIERKQLTDTAVISLGETLAKIHLLGKNASIQVTDHFKGWDKQKLLQKGKNIIEIILQQKELSDYDKLALEDIRWRMPLIESNSIKFEDFGLNNDHLTHGDYHSYNVFFDAKDHVSYVFDFEQTAYAPRVYEISRSLMFMFYNNVNDQSIDKARLYLRSYSNIYPVSKEELKAGFKLYYLRFLHSFWVPEEHYLKHNYRVDELLAERFKLLKFVSENFENLERKIFD